jgi:hypothetical protein
MKALTQNQVIKNSLYAFAKKDSIEELNAFSIKCLDGLRNWIIQNKNNISERKFEKGLMIIAEQVCNADQTVFNPGFDYDKKWFAAQLRAAGINKLDKND